MAAALAFAFVIALASGAAVAAGPAEAAPVGGPGDAPGTVSIPVRDPGPWTAEPGWLGNPSDRPEALRGAEGVVFRVRGAGRGMKWRLPLEKAIPPGLHRSIAIRCRASGTARAGDYLLAVLGRPPGGPESYRTPIPPADLRADGRWRWIDAGLGDAAAWDLQGIAVQVQAAAEEAWIEVSEVRLSREPVLSPLQDALPWAPAEGAPLSGGFETIGLGDLATADAWALAPTFRIRGPFPQGMIVSSGTPFRLLASPRSAAATGLAGEGRILLPLTGRAAELHLILAVRLEGAEEPVHGGGELRSLEGTDRSIFRVLYRRGTPDEMLCLSLAEDRFTLARGIQHAVLFLDPARDLEALEIEERSGQVEIFLLAATAARGAAGPFERRRPRRLAAAPVRAPEGPAEARGGGSGPARASLDGTRASLDAGSFRAEVDLRGLGIAGLAATAPGRTPAIGPGSGLASLRVGGLPLDPEAWEVLSARLEGPAAVRFEARVRGRGADLRARGSISAVPGEVLWEIEVANLGDPVDLEVRSPEISGLRAGDAATDVLFYPKRGAVWTSRPCAYSVPGSGLFPVQFMDLAARDGGGLSVRTMDREGLDRIYEASKGSDGARLAVTYPSGRLGRGTARAIAPAALAVHAGDWHAAFQAYRRWLATWHRPRLPLKPWFREIFNFRQRFLWFWDPLYEKETGRFRIDEALAEAREAFGGLEYLHLMDWGSHPAHGRVYGRTGDHVPWEAWKGGAPSFREALEAAARAGVPAGLYVEGYLLEERGLLGGRGKAWQIAGPSGQGLYWPGATEMFICPHAAPWREIQADTYRRLADLFPARGFYIDQLGFADWGKRCWSSSHGHEAPASPLRGEMALTRQVGEVLAARDPGIAVYTEETPCDVANVFQDGSFTYAMNEARRTDTDAPLNIARFAFPAFKTFEILICDQPTGSWAEGVGWTFFQGEGIWLEGPAREWFRPATLEMVRRAHEILREHREAFTSLEPEPLVPTLAEGVLANRFPGAREVAYTLWNSLPVTVRGPVLAVPASEVASARDAWNRRPIEPRRRPDGAMELDLEIGPRAPGCIVVTRR